MLCITINRWCNDSTNMTHIIEERQLNISQLDVFEIDGHYFWEQESTIKLQISFQHNLFLESADASRIFRFI
jgi:hypothetical protein